MKTVGIIAEYNPFHNGHKYQIEEAKRITGADTCVIVMSGNFVQRGAPAMADKYTRTQMALMGGADVVFELPVIYSTASAELFALGAVSILEGLSVDFLCFGSEWGELSLLDSLARLLTNEPSMYQELLQDFLKKGNSYPAARQAALLKYLEASNADAISDVNKIITEPNNILGIEYLKAIRQIGGSIKPFTIKRKGAGYHSKELATVPEVHSSATAIRHLVKEAYHASPSSSFYCSLQASMPECAAGLIKEGLGISLPVTEEDMACYLSYLLAILTETELAGIADNTMELANRMKAVFHSPFSYEGYTKDLKTKQYTLSRIRRILTHLLLRITNEEAKEAAASPLDTYARLLGFRKKAAPYLRHAQDSCRVPIITKLADAKKILYPAALRRLDKDILAGEIYGQIAFQKFNVKPRDEYREKVIIL